MPTPPDRWHVLADLRARADRRPGVDHRVLADVGADVHVARHHHDAGREVRAPAGLRAGHDPHAGRLVVALQRDLVPELERARARSTLMWVSRNSSRIACFSHSWTTTSPSTTSATRACAGVEQVDRLAHVRRGLGLGHHRGEVVAVLPEQGDLLRSRSDMGAASSGRGAGHAGGTTRRGARARARAGRRAGSSASRTWSAPAGTVQAARRDERAGLGQPGRDLPAVVGRLRGPQPEVEGGRAAVVDQAVRGEALEHQRPPSLVAVALLVDVLVVAERGRGRGLDRRRDDQPRVLAGLAEVAGSSSASPATKPTRMPGHVRALRQRVQREHAVGRRSSSAVAGGVGSPVNSA